MPRRSIFSLRIGSVMKIVIESLIPIIIHVYKFQPQFKYIQIYIIYSKYPIIYSKYLFEIFLINMQNKKSFFSKKQFPKIESDIISRCKYKKPRPKKALFKHPRSRFWVKSPQNISPPVKSPRSKT